MDIIKETGTMVVNNPQSNQGNAVGCSPVLQMMAKGITVGMGTDALHPRYVREHESIPDHSASQRNAAERRLV